MRSSGLRSSRSTVPAVLVDAGALIALLDRSDALHARCLEALATIREPLVTVWPALTEAMHLLGGVPRGQDALYEMVEDGAVGLVDLGADDLERMQALMEKYRDLPMDFADAALVRVAERDGLSRILTFDRHFFIYRLPRRGRFAVLTSPNSAQ
ncbi:MAG: type II toxin-antitoxin system VapC family toxin [Vicinamibacterales bacterium]